MACGAIPPKFVFEDTRHRDYRSIREGLIRRGWQQEALSRQQQVCPEVRSARDAKYSSPGQRGGAATGTASTSHKIVSCPDLIWTLSLKHSPVLRTLGPQQATNFFGATSSCLTTKAGLCRTLQSVRYGRSEIAEEIASPRSFFPRCFNLSDSSQLDDFKDNFRQTAAASVLKIACRLRTASTTSSAMPGPSPNNACGRNPDKADANCRYLKGHDVGGCCVGDCLGGVHHWMLVLAVRVCRRRLLEMSGWREGFAETRRGTNGVERLSDREWETLLLYSYILRGMGHGSSESAAEAGCRTGKALSDRKKECFAEQEFEEETSWEHACVGCDDAGDSTFNESSRGGGLRGLQDLRGTSESRSRKQENGDLARRPSSAPARRCFGSGPSEGGHRLSMHHATRAREQPLRAGCGGIHLTNQRTTPGEWMPEDTTRLQRGLVNIWGTSGCSPSTCCQCQREMRRSDGEIVDLEGRKHHHHGQLVSEAAQLCVALERRCPQWGIDGECNLWMLKPAGASKGRGVRVAWTLDQILHAQQTMGGRVVQKYLETPMLLSRFSRHPRLPVSSEQTRLRSHFQSLLNPRGIEETPQETSGSKREGSDRVPMIDEGTEAEKWKAERSARANFVNITQTLPNGEAASPPPRPAHELEDRTLSCSRDTRLTGVSSRESSAERKFDIRIWVLVTAWAPLEAFAFDECYLRVCPQRFTLAESTFADPGVHITNLSVRQARPRQRAKMRRRSSTPTAARRAATEKHECISGGHPDDVQMRTPAGDAGDARCRDECDGGEESMEGDVASQKELIQRLGEMDEVGGERRLPWQTEEDTWRRGERVWRNKVLPAIERVVRSTLLAAQSFMEPRPLSFQLFGFDLHLDRGLNPWLLEVNQSPALRHSSKRQSALIASMCEGLLQLTVDRNFQVPKTSFSNVRCDGEGSDSDATGRGGNFSSEKLHRLGQWRSISTPTPPCEHASCFKAGAKAANASVRPHGSEAFSIQGQHLSRRGVARAERGIREATAVKVLVVWWRYTVEKRRASRLRKSHAAAAICTWVAGSYPRRRLRAVMAKHARSARVIQTNWRQASARMSNSRRFVSHSAACVTVQMLWRRRKLKHRCQVRRIRRKVSSGLQGWATVLLNRRRKRAGETILRAVVAAMVWRRRNRRDAAARIVRGLRTACNRRRQGRLLLQRFAKILLAQVRLAARSRARVTRLQNRAAIIIGRAFRTVMEQSAFARAVLTLQLWYRRARCRRRRLHISTAVIQRAWRQSRQRRLMRKSSSARLAVATRPYCDYAGRGSLDTKDSETSAPAFVLNLKYLATGDQGSRAPIGVVTHGFSESLVPRNRVSGDHTQAGTSNSPHSFTFTSRTEEGCMARGSASKDKEGTSLIFDNHSMSPATTTREDWTGPDRNPAEEGAENRCSHDDDDDGSSLSCDEGNHEAVAKVQTPEPTLESLEYRSSEGQRSRPSYTGVDQGKGGSVDEGAFREGLLTLEDILPDLTKRGRKRAGRDSKLRRKKCEIYHQHRQPTGFQHQKAGEDRSGGEHCWLLQPQQINPRALTQRAYRQRDASSTTAPLAHHRRESYRREETRDCERPPLRFGIRSPVKDDGVCYATTAWQGAPSTGRASCGSVSATHSPSWPTCGRMAKSGTRVGVPNGCITRLRKLGDDFQRNRGDSGVLEMLAFLEG